MEEMNYLEKEYGIKEGQEYKITYEANKGEPHTLCGKILNFAPPQTIVKTDEGLFIMKVNYITEMRPITRVSKNTKLTLKNFEESIIGEEANIVDINLFPLHIGDVVSFYRNNEYVEDKVIAKDYNKSSFVMGLGGIEMINGIGVFRGDSFSIKFSKSYKDLKIGDKINGINVIELL